MRSATILFLAVWFLLTAWWMLRPTPIAKSSTAVTRLCDDVAPSALGDGTEELEKIRSAGNGVMAITIRRVTNDDELQREVVLLRWDGEKWSTQARFGSSQSRHWTFGMSMSISKEGNRLVVGEDGANNWAGTFHIFNYDEADGWTKFQSAKHAIPAFGEQGDEFGGAVALSANGGRIAVGAMFGGPNRVGYVRIYDLKEGLWIEDVSARDVLVGSRQGDGFGTELAFSASGDRLAVAYYNHRVRVFDRGSDGWIYAGQILSGSPNQPPSGNGDDFGRSLALSASGDRLVVGAHANYRNGINAGEVRVFDWKKQPGQWIEDEEARNLMVGCEGDGFGFKVAITEKGDRIVGTAPFGHPFGRVRVFDWNGSQWEEVLVENKLLSDASTASKGRFGYTVALTSRGAEDQLAIGKSWDSTDDAFLIRVILMTRNDLVPKAA